MTVNVFQIRMERIIAHIERLLLQHDCVIIPDFGGFVLQSIPAEYNEDSNLFSPSRKEIVFNPTLTHNDGLLNESYMQQYAVNFAKAHSLIRNDVAVMKKQLEDQSELHLGAVGLFLQENDRLIFVPEKHSGELFSIQSYGLHFFNFLPLSARNELIYNYLDNSGRIAETDVECKTGNDFVQSKNVIYHIPITRTFLHVVVATAAAILLFLIMPTPVNDINKASYTASFVPHEIMSRKSADDIASNTFSPNKDDMNTSDGDDAASTSPESASSVSPATTSSAPASASNASVSPSKPSTASGANSISTTKSNASPANAGGMKFYVIIGSYNTRTRAQAHINQLNSKEKENAGIVVKDGHVRVYAQYFSTEKEAQSYRSQLRKNSKHADAWVYKGQ